MSQKRDVYGFPIYYVRNDSNSRLSYDGCMAPLRFTLIALWVFALFPLPHASGAFRRCGEVLRVSKIGESWHRNIESIRMTLVSGSIVGRARPALVGTMTDPTILHFETGIKGLFKVEPYEQKVISKEVAAYRFDLLYGFDLVPPTFFREVDGQKGSIQLFIEDARAPETRSPPQDTRLLKLFDLIWGVHDRWHSVDGHYVNVLLSKDNEWIAIDNSGWGWSKFVIPSEAAREKLKQAFSEFPLLRNRILKTSDVDIDAAFADILSLKEIEYVKANIHTIQGAIQ